MCKEKAHYWKQVFELWNTVQCQHCAIIEDKEYAPLLKVSCDPSLGLATKEQWAMLERKLYGHQFERAPSIVIDGETVKSKFVATCHFCGLNAFFDERFSSYDASLCGARIPLAQIIRGGVPICEVSNGK